MCIFVEVWIEKCCVKAKIIYTTNMNKLVTIKSFLTSSEAYILKGQLEAEGVKCFLKNEGIVNTHAVFSDNTGQIELQVKEEDAEKASKLIEEK